MPEPVDAITRLVRGSQRNTVSENVHTVDSVREDGMVNLRVGTAPDAIVDAVPALSSYVGRKSGDRVTVRKGRGMWVVVGKAGAEQTVDTVTVTAGEGPPDGAGWTEAEKVWARGNELYVQRNTDTQPDAPAAGKVTISPNDAGGWAGGHRNTGEEPRQGTWAGYGPWSGAWFYGNKITDACAGRTVSSMSLHLVRDGSRHGYYSGQQPSIWVHGYGSAPGGNLSLSDRHDPPHGLGLGEGWDYPLTGSQVSSLADGSAKGVGVHTSEYRSDYIIFSGGGQLTITFSS